MRGVAAVVMVGLYACAQSETVTCPNGRDCPSDATCIELVSPEAFVCATPGQIAACVDVSEGDVCTLAGEPGFACHGGACIPLECGDGRVDVGEVCDDGNLVRGDGCSDQCTSNETCGNGVTDLVALDEGVERPNETCDDGNLTSGDGCSSGCSLETLRWTQIIHDAPALIEHAMTYDSVRQRVVAFGGHIDDGGPRWNLDVYELSGQTWTNVPTAVRPPPRNDAAMAFDPVRQRVVLFGGTPGESSPPYGDTWEWDGTRWELRVTSVAPAPRTDARLVYDGTRKKLVLFGGANGFIPGNFEYNDTWEWDGTSWTQVTTGLAPGGRMRPLMVADPRRGVIVIAGGTVSDNSSSTALTDTWELQGSTWRQTTGAIVPASLSLEGVAAWDPATNKVLAYGGDDQATDTYLYNGINWTAQTSTQPGVRKGAALATDMRTGDVVLVGGAPTVDDRTLFRWNGSSWTANAPFQLPARWGFASARDPQRGVEWLQGGADETGVLTSELLSYDGSEWRTFDPAGAPVRSAAGLAYDQKRQRLVLFGGSTQNVFTGGVTLATPSTWLFDGATWTSVTPPTSPPNRAAPAMVYDAKRERVVLFGGIDGNGALLGDTWEWDGTTWTAVAATGPVARGFPSLEYDPARGVVFLLGGIGDMDAQLADAWTFDGSVWALQTSASSPAPRFITVPAYDPGSRSVMIFGGYPREGLPLVDQWSCTAQGWSPVYTDEVPGARMAHATFTSPTGTGIFAVGGLSYFETFPYATHRDVWQLTSDSLDPHEVCNADRDNDGDGLRGCADPDCWARCTPACPPGTACDTNAPRCGDGLCNASLENCRNCPADGCTCDTECGDGFCDATETVAGCPGDCAP